MDATATVLFKKTRRAVLALLFEQTQRGFYLRELERLSGISSGALRHELEQLVGAGLVEKSRNGNRVHYQANSRHPVFPELRALIRKTVGLPSAIAAALEPLAADLAFAALYGSIAGARDHAASDVDLLLVGELGLARATEALAPLEERFDREINVRIYAEDEFRQRLANGDPFLTRVMAGPLTPLIGEPPRA